MHLRNKDREIVSGAEAPTTLFDQINPDVPDVVTYATTYEDILFYGGSWWHVMERNFAGWPTFAEHVYWHDVHTSVDGKVFVRGYEVDPTSMIYFDSPNPPLLTHAARAIRTCLTLDQTAAGYADEPVPLGIFTPKEGQKVNEDKGKVEQFLDTWKEARRRGVWGWIPGSVEAKVLQFNAEQIQLSEQRQHAVLEIARASGIEPEMLGVSTTSRTYMNAEQERMNLLDFTLAHYMAAMEQRLSMKDITPRGWYAKVSLDGFLRSDTKTRMEVYTAGEPLGLYPPERLAELEDIPSVRKPVVAPNTSSGDNPADERSLTVVEGG
jgi:hypothetical protein